MPTTETNKCQVCVSDAETLRRMTEAAMKKAVELGVIWKYAEEKQYLTNWNNMREIVKAALLVG